MPLGALDELTLVLEHGNQSEQSREQGTGKTI